MKIVTVHYVKIGLIGNADRSAGRWNCRHIYKKANENGGAVYYGVYSWNLSMELFINGG